MRGWQLGEMNNEFDNVWWVRRRWVEGVEGVEENLAAFVLWRRWVVRRFRGSGV